MAYKALGVLPSVNKVPASLEFRVSQAGGIKKNVLCQCFRDQKGKG